MHVPDRFSGIGRPAPLLNRPPAARHCGWGEFGYLPVHGAPLHTDIRHPASGGLQSQARGAMLAAVSRARAALLASVAGPQ